jgi:hypothetical protein
MLIVFVRDKAASPAPFAVAAALICSTMYYEIAD